MATVMARSLTVKYWQASEVLEDATEQGWFAYCPELDLEVRGKTMPIVARRINERINRMAQRAQRDINRVIEKYQNQGWTVWDQGISVRW